uniref:NUC153 domain-containing protein n=1 Tax=Echinostoma caproni TaxID=27848 RepID=A0A183B726_9TREM
LKEKLKREKQERKRRIADDRSQPKETSDVYAAFFNLTDIPAADSVEESNLMSSNLSKVHEEVSHTPFTRTSCY